MNSLRLSAAQEQDEDVLQEEIARVSGSGSICCQDTTLIGPLLYPGPCCVCGV